jgi:hydrogenase/urease accessory protein HupE
MSPRRCALALLGALISLLFVLPAAAHEVGLSRGEYTVRGAALGLEITFARRELATLVAGLDADHDGALTREELSLGRDSIEGALVGRVRVSGDGRACPGSLAGAELFEQDGVTVRAEYRCAARAQKLAIELAFMDDLPFGHRHIARATGGASPVDAVLSQRSPRFEIALPEGAAGEAPKERPGKLGFVALGIEHILTGYDHLVFLLGLILVGGRWRSILLVVTAFTVAHSITLGLAVLGVWAPSPRFVEPAIALSIAYVGVENYFVKDAQKRWRVTFPFGLIHGFGFAGALRELAVPRADVPAALVLFNLGVEAGQLLVLALALPLVYALRKREGFRSAGVKLASAAIVAAGLVWFVGRVVSPA